MRAPLFAAVPLENIPRRNVHNVVPPPARLSWTKPSGLLVISMRLSVSQDHPHFSCTTPAVEVRGCRRYGCPVVPSATILRTRRRVRRLKSKHGRGASPEQKAPFGRRLRRLREAAGLTQEELAEKADLSAKGISDLERGERRRPYPNTVRSLADALELSENERATLVAVVPGRRGSTRVAAAAVPERVLPVPSTPLVGRERNLHEVRGLIRHPEVRLLTLTGTGGVGKTRLALEAVRDSAQLFPDGRAFVALASLGNADLVMPTVVRSLGLRETKSQASREILRIHLQGKRLLLALDNFEHVLEAAPEVSSLIEVCPDLCVLVTSRAPLRVRGEHEYPVPPLTLPASTKSPAIEDVSNSASGHLFVERAKEASPIFELTAENAGAVASICRRLAGLPLALELAAAKARFLDPATILSRLEQALSSGWARDLPERQRTIRASLDWSHNLLDGPQQELFGRLSVFSSGFTLEAAEAVGVNGRIGSENVLDLLGGLVEQSLVVRSLTEGVSRYGMLEPVRQYALEKLEQSGEIEEARRVHAEYFLALAEEIEPQLIGPWEAEAFGRLEEELDNVRAALSWASEHGEAALGLRLGGALMSFWFGEGHYGEGRGWLEDALTQEGPAPALVRAKALGAASLLASEQSDHARAKWAAEEGLELSKETGIAHSREYFFPGGIPATFFLNLMATLAMNEGDLERARTLGEESLALGRQADAAHGIVWSLLILGIAATLRADYEQAERRYAEGISLGRGLASAYWRFLYLQNWGWTALLKGDPKRATVLLDEAVELARERRRGFMGLLSRPLDNLGWAALLGGDLGRARAQFGENLTLSKALGDKGTLLMSLEGLASAAGAKGNAIRAARLFGAAEALTEAIRYRLVPQERAVLEPYRSSVRSQLGKAAWDGALAQGRAMRLDEAIGYALSEE